MGTSTKIISHDSICNSVLSITTSNVVWQDKNVKSMLQEVIFGQTPRIDPEMEGWPGQKPTDRITKIEEFKR